MLILASLAVLLAPAGASPALFEAAGPGAHSFTFQRSVANLEYAVLKLRAEPPEGVGRRPEPPHGTLWYGRIMRRLPGEGPGESGHYIPFAVAYDASAAIQAWYDGNLDGDLTDDPPVSFSAYPAMEGARSFLADFHWNTPAGPREIPIEWKTRVVLEPTRGDEAPTCRIQAVYAMMGSLTLEGKAHRALLFDGNGDGLYTEDFGDGLFVDLDDDLHFDINQNTPEFGPFSTPFQMGERIYEARPIDPEGHGIAIRETGVAKASAPARVGEAAPDFSYADTTGHEVRLGDYKGRFVALYFWASWCGVCARQAPEIRSLYDRYRQAGLVILAVSFDTDRAAMSAFREKNAQVWPTSFSGRMLWEDPVARRYLADAPGTIFLIDREGRLEGIYQDESQLAGRLAELMPQAKVISR